jgi:UDP-N-acetylglucosamine 2-epimerase (non-hydrolysing)
VKEPGGDILIVFGTRPEAIKLAPVYFAFKKAGIIPKICASYQHKELLEQVLDVFKIKVDYNLDVMRPSQSLSKLTCRLVEKLSDLYKKINPRLVIVHGDTTTAFCAGLVAFYQKIKVAHVEAGLRTFDFSAPFPEEMNRQAIRMFSSFNFAPTLKSKKHLMNEGVGGDKLFYVGNTVVDALTWMTEKISEKKIKIDDGLRKKIEDFQLAGKKIVAVTLHRREGFGDSLKAACCAIKDFVKSHSDVVIIYPRHPNPAVSSFSDWLGEQEIPDQVKVVKALSYENMVYLLSQSAFIITDSGGIQEEAVSLEKFVVCVREVTERQEGVEAGFVKVVGFEDNKIKRAMAYFYNKLRTISDCEHSKVLENADTFGDGFASERIVRIIRSKLEI